MSKKNLVLQVFIAFIAGLILGVVLWLTKVDITKYTKIVSPFGQVLVAMLKMIVIPVIFLSLIDGAASVPTKEFGKIGIKVIVWYFLTSLFAAVLGSVLAIGFNPGSGEAQQAAWKTLINPQNTSEIASKANSSLTDVFISMFQNPFKALAEGNFLAALKMISERAEYSGKVKTLLEIIDVAKEAIFKIVDWILAYSPIGVFALTSVNFASYGSSLFGPYIKLTIGVVLGIFAMVVIVYPLMMAITLKVNPFKVLVKIKEPMLTAFVTRSSAAALPVSLRVAKEDLKISENISSFALPLGSTINMDGVCIHLPMFAILAANMFGVEVTFVSLSVLVLTTVLASVGAGGVPGGSLMLLFIILQNMKLSPDQIAIIVGLALGINPILDMFETMNNVTGDIVCTYSVAKLSGLVDEDK